MTASDSAVEEAAKKAGIEQITLHSKEGKLKLCKVISGHQQQIFLKNGMNQNLTKTLEKQEADCGVCK